VLRLSGGPPLIWIKALILAGAPPRRCQIGKITTFGRGKCWIAHFPAMGDNRVWLIFRLTLFANSAGT
jgi:hypothetical protein